MKNTFFALLAVASLAVASPANAGVMVLGNRTATQVAAPGDVGGALLDSFKFSLQADAGAVITAVDLVFAGGVHQVQLGGAFGSVTRTPSIDNLTGFPAEYIAADTHTLIASTDFVVPSGVGSLTEDALSGLSSGAPGGGIVPKLTLQNIALGGSKQTNLVDLAQLVIPRGGLITFSGTVATSNDGGVPVAISGVIQAVPEPATLAMAGLGLIGCVAAARRRNA
jgi:hypothetical protein